MANGVAVANGTAVDHGTTLDQRATLANGTRPPWPHGTTLALETTLAHGTALAHRDRPGTPGPPYTLAHGTP